MIVMMNMNNNEKILRQGPLNESARVERCWQMY